MKNYIEFQNINNNKIPISIRTSSSEFSFREITDEELMKKRMSEEAGVVYKVGNKLFYADVAPDLNIYVLAKSAKTTGHLCWENCYMLCRGCPRTRDLTVPFQVKYDENLERAVMASWRIEKYPFITEGIEAFNMKTGKDALSVISCSSYKQSVERKVPRKNVRRIKQSIRDFYKLLGE